MPPTVYPDELLSSICATIFSSALPPTRDSLDPLIERTSGPSPTALPSTWPPPSWPEPLARATLVNLTLVNKAWYHAAKPWLWRQVEVRLPRSWLALVDEITGGEDQVDEQASELVDKSIREAVEAAMAVTSPGVRDPDKAARLQRTIIKGLSGSPESAIPPSLLSPPASREASPARPTHTRASRSKSPGRWRLIRNISNVVQETVEPGVYIPMPQDIRPGRHIQHLNFNHFRTIGMRRSVGEGISSRFVTGERLELALKEIPNLISFGATEYMDGALTLPVLSELLFRGYGRAARERRRLDRKRDPSPEERMEADSDWARRRDCKPLESLDLCGCVSGVFVNALAEFAAAHFPEEVAEVDDQRRGRRDHNPIDEAAPVTFPYLQRLGLRGVTSVPSAVLTPFVLAFPSLTHLDLSGTRCTPELLEALGQSPSVRLSSLALARCTRLTSASISSLLIHGTATREIEELSLYGDATFPCPLDERDLDRIIVQAPCFRTGQLKYLDLSSCPVTSVILDSFASQPALRSLGLSHIAQLPLSSLAHFLSTRAPQVEIITLVSSSPELGATANLRQVSLALHSKIITPLCTPPLTFSLSQLDLPPQPPATSLRVIELANAALNALNSGAGNWRIVKSKGGRGWYVDTSSGWVSDTGDQPSLRRNLTPAHPLRIEYTRLADANGNVGSGIGWFSRKMEVLHGTGLLGRESGLYGAVAFAFT